MAEVTKVTMSEKDTKELAKAFKFNKAKVYGGTLAIGVISGAIGYYGFGKSKKGAIWMSILGLVVGGIALSLSEMKKSFEKSGGDVLGKMMEQGFEKMGTTTTTTPSTPKPESPKPTMSVRPMEK